MQLKSLQIGAQRRSDESMNNSGGSKSKPGLLFLLSFKNALDTSASVNGESRDSRLMFEFLFAAFSLFWEKLLSLKASTWSILKSLFSD